MSVSIVRTFDHYKGSLNALELIEGEIREVVDNRRKFLIKPNFVSTTTYLAATPIETVEAILYFISSRFEPSEILIGESPSMGPLKDALKNFGYHRIKNLYREVEFVDLDDYDQQRFVLVDENGKEFEVYVSKLLLDKSYVRISPCRAKTHDTVIVTLSIKNIVMGSIKRGWKHEMHRGYLSINYNIAKLATYMMPDLGLVDGVEAMEGNGPIAGSPKRWGVIFASTNPVNLDAVVSYAMGFNPADIGYLYFLWRWGYGEIDVSKIKVVGGNLEEVKTVFRPHYAYEMQLSWKDRARKLGFI
ncbi:MAG: DUF362 domain-containing protein [Ignisphaera sp.]